MAAAAAVAVVAQQGDAAATDNYGQWSPGANARVSALEAAPQAVPASVRATAEHGARQTGGDPALAAASIRPLQVGLGRLNHGLYAFRPAAEATCLVLSGRGMTCPAADKSDTPGLVWMVAGGYPAGAIGNDLEVPSAFVGVVDDSVSSVSFTSNGETKRVPIKRNSVYVELVPPESGAHWTMEIAITYRDGTTRMLPLHDPRP